MSHFLRHGILDFKIEMNSLIPITEVSSLVALYAFENNIEDSYGSYDLSIGGWDSSSGYNLNYISGIYGNAYLTPENSVNGTEVALWTDKFQTFKNTNSWSITAWFNCRGEGGQDAGSSRLVEIAQGGPAFDTVSADIHFGDPVESDYRITFRRFKWEAVTPDPDSSEYSYVGDASLYNSWHFLAFTYDYSIHKCYIDNEFVGSFYSSLNITEPSGYGYVNKLILGSFVLGAEKCAYEYNTQTGSTTPYTFNGYIDQFRIFNEALDASEISHYWNNGLGG